MTVTLIQWPGSDSLAGREEGSVADGKVSDCSAWRGSSQRYCVHSGKEEGIIN